MPSELRDITVLKRHLREEYQSELVLEKDLIRQSKQGGNIDV